MPVRSRSQLFNSLGTPVVLTDKLAPDGGEGAIFSVLNKPGLAAKIYHRSVSPEKAAKLRLMINLRTEELLKIAAWPIDTLHDRPAGPIVGFVMPKVNNHKVVHELYSIKSRLIEFPEARWSFLIHAASNITRAVGTVHKHNHVIGDINHGSMGISKGGTVILFDCDSFQITTNTHQYLCEVGVDTHTPPELQAASFRGVVRSTDHDAFGLAVLIFQLLFLGRHPFSGQFLASTEQPPIGKLIADYRFAYGPTAASRQMQQPPGTLDLQAVSPNVAHLFERAFSRTKPRPTPNEWITSLEHLAVSLSQCNTNTSHQFYKGLTACPWCRIEALSGVVIFAYVGVPAQADGFHLANVWTLIGALPSPGPLPPLPNRKDFHLTRSPIASKIKRQEFLRSILISSSFVVVAAIAIALPMSASAMVWIIVIACAVSLAIANKTHRKDQGKLEAQRDLAEHHWRAARQRWNEQASAAQFENKRRELENQRQEYEGLANGRQQKLQALQRNIRQRQLHNFLDRHLISRAGINGIGPGRQATLRSYGIETAADIDWRTVGKVPGFGPVYTSKLLAWRGSIEQRFVFNPNVGVDPADRKAVEVEIATARARLERALQHGSLQLRQINQQILNARSTMRPVIEETLKAAAQAELDAGTTLSLALRTVPILFVLVISLITTFYLRRDTAKSTRVVPAASPAASVPANPVSIPTPSLEQRRADARLRYTEGLQLTKARKYAEATTAYRESLSLDPDFAEAYHELAFALYRTRQFRESVTTARRAIQLEPDNAESYRVLGLAHAAMREWKEAVDAIEQSLKIEPNNPVTYYQLGMVYKGSEDFESAIPAFKEAIRLQPEYGSAHYELGLSYVIIGQTDLAMEQYNVLTAINPKLAQKLFEYMEG
jgi:DNA-binding helix-hairpin-helix protein with protein kinase domain/Flp pilus assembly protein TadD